MKEPNALPVASLRKRIGAFVIDEIVVSLFFMVIFYEQISTLFSDVTVVDQEVLNAFNMFIAENILIVFSVKILYHAVLIWQSGMTFGKYMMKIKAVDLETGNRLSFYKALLRAILRIGSEVLFYAGFLMAWFMPLRQTFHDKLSNCVVIDV